MLFPCMVQYQPHQVSSSSMPECGLIVDRSLDYVLDIPEFLANCELPDLLSFEVGNIPASVWFLGSN
eukprot:CAMPEP_0171331716 /NCGR_PEP_ID=MMETSP0878-20121228/2874_1 /TAXON_ID=67004 /ORGANISM="Thalassiosira weissflogii, Strain CCMP1336" /LENGTH=66 /DNA_ID=CAMNT_0011832305 /DNA_START=223 /DNA_END=423 /DNA_ORIENTATION=+